MHDMKKEILPTVHTFIRKGLAVTLMISALLMTLIPYTGGAQGNHSSKKQDPIIKYLGLVADKLVFQVDLDNSLQKQVMVSIRDDDGTILFSEKVKDQKFSRKFAFEKEEFKDRKIIFEVYGAKENSAQTFQVSQQLRLVEDLVITRH